MDIIRISVSTITVHAPNVHTHTRTHDVPADVQRSPHIAMDCRYLACTIPHGHGVNDSSSSVSLAAAVLKSCGEDGGQLLHVVRQEVNELGRDAGLEAWENTRREVKHVCNA